MDKSQLISTVGEFITGSSQTINYLAVKYKETLNQIYTTIDKMKEPPYSDILNYVDDLHYIYYVSYHSAKAYENFNQVYKNIYIKSHDDIPNALDTIEGVTSDIDKTFGIISAFNSLSMPVITTAGSMEANPNEYEALMKYFNTLSRLIEELNMNFQALSNTIQNIGYLYQSIK